MEGTIKVEILAFALLLAWQVHEEPAWQASEHGVVEVKWPVCRADDDHVAVFRRLQPIHLLHEFSNHSTVGDRVAGLSRQPRAKQGIELVNEDDAGR